MIYDKWRNQNSPGEVNPFPSLTQPCRVFSVMDYLTRPDLVLQERHPFAEIQVDPNDPSAFDRVPDPDDILDNFEYEVPRDPDLYGSAPVRRPSKPRAQANGSKDPKQGARSESEAGKASLDERAPVAEENRVATEDK